MRGAALLLVLCAAVISGCAALTARGPDPYSRLEAGVSALERQDYERSRSLLEPLYLERWSEPVGQRAMLALISMDLDSRNLNRNLWNAADGAARLLNVPGLEPWIVPVAETYYLLAVELGAQEARLAEADSAEAEAQSGRTLPQTGRETVPARISRLEDERVTLQRRVTQLEEQLAASNAALRETQQELERIKRTIKP